MKETRQNLKSACAYIRVSTEQQEELSPDSQKRLLKDYAEKNNIIITKFYEDLGISGRKADKRPEFQTMISDCKSKDHPYDVILVWKFSRFARNQEESILYKSLLNKAKIEVVSVSETVPDGMVGGLVERIFEWMDEYYSINLSGEAKRGWEEKRLKGGYPASCPYGYDYIKGDVPVINEEQIKIVRKIFDMYLKEDRSAAYITKWLNQNGHRTKFDRPWHNCYVTDLLVNPFFAGKIRWKAYDGNKHLKPISEWIIMDGKHEPIITMEEFEQSYQKRLRQGAHKRRGANGCKNWISGLVKCAHCGATLIYCKESKHNYSYFRCKEYIRGMCSHPNYVTEAKLTRDIIDGLKNISTLDTDFCFKTIQESQSSDLNSISKQISEIDKKLKRIRSAFINGIDTLDEYKSSKEKLESEKNDLLKYLQTSNSPTNEDKEKMISNIENVISIITDEESDMFRKSQAIRSICEKIVYNKEADEIDFFFYLS
ncbi:MAG: recombinase family protein [Velocimicrobium sp.]